MPLKATSREHFDEVLCLPHERLAPTEPTAWYATDDDKIVAEVGFDPTRERWLGVVYASQPDGWAEVDQFGDGFFDLDDAERYLVSAIAELQTRDGRRHST